MNSARTINVNGRPLTAEAAIQFCTDELARIKIEEAREKARAAISHAFDRAGVSEPSTDRDVPVTRRAPAPRKRKAGRRGADELLRVEAALVEYVHRHPGETMEQIKVSMGGRTAALQRPAKAAIDAGLIKTRGERRWTRYYPAHQ